MSQGENIEWVVANSLCTSCGTCVAACPHDAIRMVETPGGLLLASVDADKCSFCGICTKVCPGWHLESGALAAELDPFKGQVIRAYCSQATDKKLLSGAQSGGLITALLCHLIDSGQIDNAVVTQMLEDGSLRPKTVVISDRTGIWKARGSKYCPVAVNAAITDEVKGQRLAVVGLGCHMHGICNAQTHHVSWALNISLKIGLMCDRILGFGAIDYLIHKARVSRKDVTSFEFRSKEWRGWPGDVRICTKTGVVYNISRTHRLFCKNTFTPARCRLCFDKFNVLSDLVVGDPYGIREDTQGNSVVITRTQKGVDSLLSAQTAGVLELEPVDFETIFELQEVEERRKNCTAYMSVWKQMGHSVPDFTFDSKWQADTSSVSLRPYHYQLNWARHLARQRSVKQAFSAAKRHLFLLKLGKLLSLRIMAWRVFSLLRRLCSK